MPRRLGVLLNAPYLRDGTLKGTSYKLNLRWRYCLVTDTSLLSTHRSNPFVSRIDLKEVV
jgi:hypothetical protein